MRTCLAAEGLGDYVPHVLLLTGSVTVRDSEEEFTACRPLNIHDCLSFLETFRLGSMLCPLVCDSSILLLTMCCIS